MSREAAAFLRQMAKTRACGLPARLPPLDGHAAADLLLELPLAEADECDGTGPPFDDWQMLVAPEAPLTSRRPAGGVRSTVLRGNSSQLQHADCE